MDFDGTSETTPTNPEAHVFNPVAPGNVNELPNPYAAPILDAEIVEEPDHDSPSFAPRPRAWTSFLVVGVCGICFLAASVVLTFAAVYIVHGSINVQLLGDEDSFGSVMESRTGLFVMVVLPQAGTRFTSDCGGHFVSSRNLSSVGSGSRSVADLDLGCRGDGDPFGRNGFCNCGRDVHARERVTEGAVECLSHAR